MRSAAWIGGREFEIREGPEPEPGPGEVRVRVRACGVCQTEVHIMDGLLTQINLPSMMGHEFGGEVEAIGADVTSLEVGMPVACQFGAGGYADQAVGPAERLFPLPDGVPVQHGALVEPMACIVAAVEQAELPMGATALLTGAGPMGLVVLQLASRSRAARVIVSEPNADRRALALRLGADQAVDPGEGHLEEVVAEATRGAGVAVAFESSGQPAALADCLRSVADGGSVMMVGVHPNEARIPLNLYDFHRSRLRLLGIWGGGRDGFRAAAQWLPHLELEPLISHRFELADIAEAFDVARTGEGLKILVGTGLC
ncbi:MAG: hypothetical protein CL878_08825 [Dehalococcoidia bacterium]|nr:hypothetical protein [Dehalococcoidia bacterium]